MTQDTQPLSTDAAQKRIVLSSDHAAIALRQVVAAHIAAQGWQVVDIGPTTPESTHYPNMARQRRGGWLRAIAGLALCCVAPGRAS